VISMWSAEDPRRGLPRTVGGDPWPPPRFALHPDTLVSSALHDPDSHPNDALFNLDPGTPAEADKRVAIHPGDPADGFTEVTLRAGLPRAEGGPGWPTNSVVRVPESLASSLRLPAREPAADQSTTPSPDQVAADSRAGNRDRTLRSSDRADNRRPGLSKRSARLAATIITGAATIGVVFLGSRWLIGVEPVATFVAKFHGEAPLPANAPQGLPAWVGWQHFFNAFLMVLIIRTGIQIRREQRPTAFWTSRGTNGKKISLTLWLHQSLDLLWLLNGLVFAVLLFATGQWMRIVPTSWEIFPHALSAGLQYASLDWPTENGWVNYNALQQLSYFTTVFIAAPLSVLSGFRMSGLWPSRAKRLSRIFSIERARAVHFPVMVYFVAFIVVHVALVASTGVLRNLNHMYAARGSTNPDTYAQDWTGFWIFILSVIAIIGAWMAARPSIITPVARLTGRVTAR